MNFPPAAIVAAIVLLLLAWCVAAFAIAWIFGGIVRLRDSRAARPRYRRGGVR